MAEPGGPGMGIAPAGVYDLALAGLRPVRGLKILDVPCASGGFAAQLESEGATCVAADLAAAMRHQPAVVLDMNRSLPFPDGAFDAVTCLEGIEHTHDPRALIREFHRLLRPGGRLVLSTPNIHNLRSRIKFALRGTLFWFDPREVTGIGHVTVIPYFILKHLLAEAGFSNLVVQTNGSVRPSVPCWLAGVMQRVFSKPTETDQELNSPMLLNGESLIWFAQKTGNRG